MIAAAARRAIRRRDSGRATSKVYNTHTATRFFRRKVTFRAQDMFVDTEGISPGRHRLRFQISDYQETRNMENVGAVLPNTRRITPTFRIVSP